MANKKIIVSVTNDISNDQRVHKVCTSLVKMGFDVVVVGRKRKDSTEINRSYSTHRFKLLFNKGALFYAEYNLRLFFYLLFHSFDFLLANDLDSLLANHLAAKVKRKSVVYDSHEYFTEVPELQGRAFAKNTWIKIEKMCLPGASRMYTVNESIAKLYKEKYNREVEVIRNVPPVFSYKIENAKTEKEKLGLPTDKKLLVVQG
ncbi:MAG: glycosyltransferase, partial [Bacteroidia bacterium]|nr:glycosyltransferase [Bacteroidia bacterium]